MEDSFHQVLFHPVTLSVIGRLLVLLLLLFISAFVSGAETAFFSLSPKEVAQLTKSDKRGAKAAIKLLGMQDYLLGTILITNNLVNICAVILSNSIIDQLVTFHSVGIEFTVKVIMVTFLLLLFGEIMPKILATSKAAGMTRIVAGPLLFLKKIFQPFSYLLIRSSSRINEKVATKKANISMDELSDAIEITSDQTSEEKKILSGIVNFINIEVEEIMRPRVDMVALDVESDFESVCKTVRDSGFSRIPVYEDGLDNIKGILYVKDLLPYLSSNTEFNWQKLIREPYFVPEHKKINDLFGEFQNNKIHIAIVVDEYGSTQGLVSLEDILEEIVGEISDESDIDKDYFTKIDENNYLFEGKTHILDFLKVIDFEEDYLNDDKGESESIAGLMLEKKKDFLLPGDSLSLRELNLKVEAVDGRRITKIRVNIHRQPEEDS